VRDASVEVNECREVTIQAVASAENALACHRSPPMSHIVKLMGGRAVGWVHVRGNDTGMNERQRTFAPVVAGADVTPAGHHAWLGTTMDASYPDEHPRIT
jgi:hypothetical protein